MYEGVTERIAEHVADKSVRIGDYVISGGEPAAVVILDAVARPIPGVIGNAASLDEESFENAPSCEYPQYTRPEVWHGQRLTNVLLSGDHARIAAWRAAQKTG
ncbi:MAG: hypothetical protein NZM25_11155 [Leptospiraceae bacterium]|nr:hypothetical protein [Leptospiraceae bacterium]